MVTDYIAFELSPGQMPPAGATGITISGTNEIVWAAEEGTFNVNASFGTILPGETTPESTLINRSMTQQEIDAYLA